MSLRVACAWCLHDANYNFSDLFMSTTLFNFLQLLTTFFNLPIPAMISYGFAVNDTKLDKQMNAFKVTGEMFDAVMTLAHHHHRKQSEMLRELIRLGLILQAEVESTTKHAAERLSGKPHGNHKKTA